MTRCSPIHDDHVPTAPLEGERTAQTHDPGTDDGDGIGWCVVQGPAGWNVHWNRYYSTT